MKENSEKGLENETRKKRQPSKVCYQASYHCEHLEFNRAGKLPGVKHKALNLDLSHWKREGTEEFIHGFSSVSG